MAQLLDHAVEGGRELADLVLGRDGDALVEAPCLDLAGPGQQQPHRAGDAAANHQREGKSDHRRKDRDDAGDDDGLALVTDHLRR